MPLSNSGFQVGDFVASRGIIGTIDPFDRERFEEFDVRQVVKIDGDQVDVAPGGFDGAGRWSRKRSSRTAHISDLEKIEPPVAP